MSQGPYDAGKKYLASGGFLNRLLTEQRTNRLLPGAGYDLQRLPGQGTRIKGLSAGAGGAQWWTLEPAPEGQWKIGNPGRIYADASKLDSAFTIADLAEPFSLGVGDVVALELTYDSEGVPEWALYAGEPGPDYPSIYEWSEPPEVPRVARALFVLHEVKSGALPDGAIGQPLGANWAESHLSARDYVYRIDGYTLDETWSHLPAPVLVPR